jgi:hypothetical protein
MTRRATPADVARLRDIIDRYDAAPPAEVFGVLCSLVDERRLDVDDAVAVFGHWWSKRSLARQEEELGRRMAELHSLFVARRVENQRQRPLHEPTCSEEGSTP